jgi:uncharacterized protein (DUF736 family)
MATIGTFKKTGSNEFTGDIVTLSVQAKNVRIVADQRATGENAPSHRVLVGRAEIGAAWSKRSNEGRDYLGLKLDDPSFNAPIYANLFDDEDESFSLIWSRPTGRRGDCGPARGPGRKAGAFGFTATESVAALLGCTAPKEALPAGRSNQVRLL